MKPKTGELQINNICASQHKVTVLNNVFLTAKLGQVTGLLGPNGAGKTTLFNIITGFMNPTSGSIQLLDHDLTKLSITQRIQYGLSYLPQKPCIYRGLTIADNIMSVLEFHEPDQCKRLTKLKTLLESYGLTEVANHLGKHVSGGQQRRAEIARCMATNPKLILLDEPFTGIDPIAIHQLNKLILQLSQSGIGILITDHNVEATLKICNHAYIMLDGKILSQGQPEDILADSMTRQHYLGTEET